MTPNRPHSEEPVPPGDLGKEPVPSVDRAEESAPAADLQVIRAKLGVPRLPVDVVSRPRLLEKLDAPGARVVLVSAPAGSGKTVLIQDWLGGTGTPVAWLSLDTLDNEPARFLAHFGAALALVELPGMQKAAETIRALARTGEKATAPLTATLSDAEENPVVVLDDVHLVEDPFLVDLLSALVTDRPSGPRLVLLSRVDPPLPLARLRLSGTLTEIRQRDLRFTEEEAAELFSRALPDELAPELVERLEARTEGWAAGLRMAALALQQAQDPREAAETFAGSHELLADYLLEEALRGQDPEVQRFLMETSVLPRFDGDACAFVLQNPEARQHLQTVEEANLFLVSLDTRRRWYRYHHLFAELLRFRLLDTDPERVEELRERASQWFESQGEVQEALAQAAEMEGTGRLVALLDAHGYPILARSEFASFARWLTRVPDPLSQPWPMFLAALTWFRTQTERNPELTELLEALELAIENPVDGYPAERIQEARHHLSVLRAFGYRVLDRFADALEAGKAALASLPDHAVAFRGILPRAIPLQGD